MNEVKNKDVYVIKANGEREIFESKKLESSLRRAGTSPKVITEVVETIKGRLIDEMTTAEIYREAFRLLKEIEGATIAVKYSVRRAVMELGPDGFSFEDFVGAMFRAAGYRIRLRQSIKGLCVSHEIDVIAENEEDFLMAEVKFHNKQGMKSDLKVILYIKERFDDITKGEFWNNVKKGLKKNFWLITNTKFTNKAIEYAECCPGLKLMSWNYPEGGSLNEFIDNEKLYPLTCLESLSNYDKKLFLKNRVVLCRELKQGGERLFNLVGISPEKREAVLQEIENLLIRHE
ncbi:MAG: restriction endonuclease [Patescibacteria group bacterium]|nr:restriction endonuclease [Patescibacteria group bacterium]